MTLGRSAALAAAVAILAGCGTGDLPRPAYPCTADDAAIARALEAAPGRVALEGGTTLSACVDAARSDADLQNVGATFTRAAEDLEDPAMTGDAEAAVRLGYLVGAARRGARRSSGVAAELVRRLERSAAAVDGVGGAPQAALARGLRAGEDLG